MATLDIVTKCLCYLSFMCIVLGAADFKNCTKINSCSCKTEDGRVVDLTSLTSTTQQARFSDVKAPSGVMFSWNPCKDFSEGTGCANVAACQIPKGTLVSTYPLGEQQSATFSMNAQKNLEIAYSQMFAGIKRQSHVELICDKNTIGDFTASGEAETAQYFMSLRSKYACATSGSSEDNDHSLSTGTILCILVLVLTIVYLSVGISVQKFVRQASGKEIFPNISFWSELPGLIKEGFVFTISKCKRGGSTYEYI